MRRYTRLIFPLFLSLAVAGCAPSRGAADKKLAAACEAAVKVTFSGTADQISNAKASFSFEKSHDGRQLRVVALSVKHSHDGGTPEDKTYTCAYAENWTFFSYLPEFYNLERDGQKYGNFDGMLLGDMLTMTKIVEASSKVLHGNSPF
jgi:hypothetical protein